MKSNDFNLPLRIVKGHMLSHPEYPNASSMMDLFSLFNVKYTFLKIDKNSLHNIKYPFLGHTIRKNVSDFEIVKTKIQLINNLNEFYESWDGIMITIEKQDHALSTQLKIFEQEENTIKLRNKFFTGGMVVMVLYILSLHFNFYSTTFFLLNVIGLVLCIMLLLSEFDVDSLALEKFCNSKVGQSCLKFNNDYSPKLLMDLGLADFGLVYFACLCLWALILMSVGMTSPILTSILPFCGISIPVVLYSIIAQKFKIKMWCRICLCIDAILLLNTFIGLITFDVKAIENGLVVSMPVLLLSLLISSSWIYIKKILLNGIIEQNKSIELLKRQYNPRYFFNYLSCQKFVDTAPVKGDLLVGSPLAKTKILIVTNPHCQYCSELHEAIEGVLENYPDDIFLTIRFSVENDESSLNYRATQQILQAYILRPSQLKIILSTWFKLMNTDKFKKYFQLTDELQDYTIIKSHSEWCNINRINRTPSLIINGYLIPKEYDLKQLCFFMPILIRNQSNAD
ncbi:thioredoxin domain-containing protein [Mucilaginibacter paludis]|nr:thioredoxin domain-containing protein [Mucilaginibacter paludis]